MRTSVTPSLTFLRASVPVILSIFLLLTRSFSPVLSAALIALLSFYVSHVSYSISSHSLCIAGTSLFTPTAPTWRGWPSVQCRLRPSFSATASTMLLSGPITCLNSSVTAPPLSESLRPPKFAQHPAPSALPASEVPHSQCQHLPHHAKETKTEDSCRKRENCTVNAETLRWFFEQKSTSGLEVACAWLHIASELHRRPSVPAHCNCMYRTHQNRRGDRQHRSPHPVSLRALVADPRHAPHRVLFITKTVDSHY